MLAGRQAKRSPFTDCWEIQRTVQGIDDALLPKDEGIDAQRAKRWLPTLQCASHWPWISHSDFI